MTVSMRKEEYAKLTEALAKLRDWLQAGQELRESIDEFLNLALQNEVAEWNPGNIKWTQDEGPSGSYEMASQENNKDNRDFGLLVRDLQEHKNRMTKGSFFYWLFSDGSRVGRKPQKKAAKK